MNTNTDTGKFRMALLQSGFSNLSSHGNIYSHVRRSTGHRRLKLWCADTINASDTEAQRLLETRLKSQFGNRYLTGYFVPHWQWNCSLCIILKD